MVESATPSIAGTVRHDLDSFRHRAEFRESLEFLRTAVVRVLPDVLTALRNLGVAVILSTSGRREIQGISDEIYVADLLPLSVTASVSQLMISRGGCGALYPAMAAGTPVLAIPSNADQHLSTEALIRNGAGVGIRAEEASWRRLKYAMESILHNQQFHRRAQEWRQIYSRYDSASLFGNFLRSVFTSGAGN